MTKSLKEIIENEIDESKKKYGNQWVIEFFNNFNGHLPGGYKRRGIQDFNDWDERFSETLRKQSLKEFHRTIDKVSEELGINQQEIIDIQKTLQEKNNFSVYEKLFELCIPIYVKLREMGYNHYPDLTS